ncbi:SurA N-terminal domain-containing protein [Marinobacterium jannaschii]|uniref:SurA N-terminal domain-containing protein n=1 Tax=Marinobacterium jannaschii TaxID=64970 RepID=UPI000489E43E|nr:SurA N-terminal domain-containing protein [Marinobacterium jannaschii]
MLQTIRENSQGMIAKVIVGLIVITFALFGVESLVSLTGGSSAPATVNGVEISEQQLYQGVELQRRQILAQMGENADPTLLDDGLISNMVLEGLIEQSVLVQAAEEQGMTFSDRMIDQLIVSTPAFQQDGKFSREQFELALRSSGFTPITYRQLLRQEKLIEQQRAAYLMSAFALEDEVKQVLALDRQTRDISYFTLSADKVREGLVVSDEQVAERFARDQAQYMTDEQVELEYLLLDQAELAKEIEVTEDELRQQYQVMLDNYSADEMRQAAHILVEIGEELDDAAALAKAQSLAERLTAGEDFAALASEASDDLGSSESGGDLGMNGKGVFDPAFEAALYELAVDQVSEPVRTEFGYHLIKLLGTQASSAPSYTEAKAELERDLLKNKAEELYVERLEQLADISFSAGDLVEPAEALGLEIKTTGLFSREGGSDPVSSNVKVLKVAFSEELLEESVNSTPVELSSNAAVVVRVKQHQPPRNQSLDEVRDLVRDALVAELTAKQLEAQGQDKVERLRAGDAIEAVASGVEVKRIEALGRGQSEAPIELTQAVFKLAHPQSGKATYSAVPQADGSQIIVALHAVKDGDTTALAEAELNSLRMILGSQVGQADYRDFTAQAVKAAEIERL